MPSITLTKCGKDSDNRVRFQFGKRGYEFHDLAAANAFVKSQLDRDTLDTIMMALVMSRQPTLANPAALNGRTLTVDFSLANWGSVS